MKKTYINPTMVVVKVNMQQLLAGSVQAVVFDSGDEYIPGTDEVGAPDLNLDW